jgi:hypothetical protein
MRSREFLIEKAPTPTPGMKNKNAGLAASKVPMGQPPEVEPILKKLGYKDIKRAGNFLIVVVEIPPKSKNMEFRVEVMKKIAAGLQATFPGTIYNPIQSTKSSIGFVDIPNNPIKVLVKDTKKQGTKRAGVANEHQLVALIQEQIQAYGKVDVFFQDDRGRRLEVPDVINIVASGTDTKDRKKADVVLHSALSKVPVSIKQENAEVWESADTLFGARARQIIDKLKKDGLVNLNQINQIQVKGQLLPVYKLDKEIVVQPTSQDAMQAVFGSDLNPEGGIIVQDFQPHHFVQYDDTIIIDCYAVIKTQEDIPESHLMYFLIKNMPGRASLGYYGLGTQAVTMSRAFGKHLTKSPIFVDQAGNPVSAPKPRNPAVE